MIMMMMIMMMVVVVMLTMSRRMSWITTMAVKQWNNVGLIYP